MTRPADEAWKIIQTMRRLGLNPASYTGAEASKWWEQYKQEKRQKSDARS